MRPYETRSWLGTFGSCLRYLIKTFLTFGSCLVYLVNTGSLLGLVLFTLLRLFLESHIISVLEGLVSSHISTLLEVSPKKPCSLFCIAFTTFLINLIHEVRMVRMIIFELTLATKTGCIPISLIFIFT